MGCAQCRLDRRRRRRDDCGDDRGTAARTCQGEDWIEATLTGASLPSPSLEFKASGQDRAAFHACTGGRRLGDRRRSSPLWPVRSLQRRRGGNCRSWPDDSSGGGANCTCCRHFQCAGAEGPVVPELAQRSACGLQRLCGVPRLKGGGLATATGYGVNIFLTYRNAGM